MLAWGIVMTCMGVVQSYGGLLAARFFLGIAEVSWRAVNPARRSMLTTIAGRLLSGRNIPVRCLTMRRCCRC